MVFGFEIPLWILIILGLLIVLVAWKFIKFALKILIVIIIVFLFLLGLDYGFFLPHFSISDTISLKEKIQLSLRLNAIKYISRSTNSNLFILKISVAPLIIIYCLTRNFTHIIHQLFNIFLF